MKIESYDKIEFKENAYNKGLYHLYFFIGDELLKVTENKSISEIISGLDIKLTLDKTLNYFFLSELILRNKRIFL